MESNYQNEYQNNYQSTYQNAYQSQYGQNPADGMGMGMGEGYVQPLQQGFTGVNTALQQEVVAKSFLFMVAALVVTAFAALTTSPYVAMRMLSGYNFFILLGVELAIVLFSNWAVKRNNAVLAGVLFAVYSYLTGVTFSILFLAFTMTSIASVFFITAALFGIMAVYGILTKKDLTKAGSLLLMGLIGIILASVVNMFLLHSSMLDTAICLIGVLIFVGLTAYDTQKIKNMAAYSDGRNVLSLAMFGAFELYLDFINLFLKLLRLFGKSRD